MSTGSGIEWTDATWNPVVGCTPVSPGCLNCYAAGMARRHRANPSQVDYHDDRIDVGAEGGGEKIKSLPIVETRGGRAVFTGLVRCLPEKLGVPLRWKKPRRVFVNSMSDLFHESVPFEFIDRVFAVMALCPRHTFQVLTKRPERMAEYLATRGGLETRKMVVAQVIDDELAAMGLGPASEVARGVRTHPCGALVWPLGNVWLGTSCENQAMADERVPHLLRCPAAVRFVSAEPLLGAIDFDRIVNGAMHYRPLAGKAMNVFDHDEEINFARLHWVIVGGESGAGARPCDVQWVRSIVGQCKAAKVACFVKQLGARPIEGDVKCGECNGTGRDPDVEECPFCIGGVKALTLDPLKDRKGGDPAEWPETLRVREVPRVAGASACAEGS